MTISKTRIEKKVARKKNPELKELIFKLKKQNKLDIASAIALPKRKRIEVSIRKIDKETKAGDNVLVPGKVLGGGEMSHSITIAALSFSKDARLKLKDCSIKDILEMIKNKDVKVIK